MKKLFVSAVAVAAMSASAAAADFGSANGIADLEERVAELEATVARKGNRKVSLTVYGQVNAGILWTDGSAKSREWNEVDDELVPDPWESDGSGSDKRIFDNNVSESRFGFRGEAKINDSVKAGFLLEIGVGEKLDDDYDIGRSVSVRHAAWFLESTQLGRVTVGKTSQATDDIDTISLANIGAAVKMLSVEPVAGQYLGVDLPFDGGKTNVARYDTPSIAGFVASASWADEDTWDVALRYAGEFGQVRVAGGVGYRNEQDAETWLVNAGLMHVPSGIFLQGAYGDIDIDLGVGENGSGDGWHVLGGIEQKAFAIGKTTVFGEYAELSGDVVGCGDGCDTLADGDLKWWGFGVVQAIDAAAMDLYATFRQYDASGRDYDGLVEGKLDAKVFQAGARIKF